MTNQREPRFRLLCVSEYQIIDILYFSKGIYALPRANGLPAGCEVVSVHHNPTNRCFDYLLWHESFDLVPDFTCPPRIEVAWKVVEVFDHKAGKPVIIEENS